MNENNVHELLSNCTMITEWLSKHILLYNGTPSLRYGIYVKCLENFAVTNNLFSGHPVITNF